ncbi:hypothetical protein AMJ71_06155 [candidate division TA06 bacterium SM1_40]|uniref:Uncharacterized protein n=1 Tax=candidate division TA06 bacterium SM1_40 TaxID=1703773 RepID=A0A0S8JL68_UNCT6|nr:MAG: hypothetical protein AMJ71_06155 [candidate division TA06 bacterium SM1_40]
MAGGSASDIRTPFPFDEYLIEFGTFDIAASKSSDYQVDNFTVPFACRAVRCEVTATDVNVTNGITINIEDDTPTTPKVVVSDAAVAAITAGAGKSEALTVDRTKTIFAGAVLKCSYKSGASDDAENVKVRLWVEPVN